VVHPGFQFTPFMGCSWDSLIFTNTSTNATKYLWSFGDGTSDTSMNPTHNYNIATDTIHRYVTLRAYNPACHSDSVTKDIVLYPVPAKPFLYDMTADQAIPYGRSIQLGVHGGWIYYWKPDNGTLNNPNISNPIASPQEKTTYTVYSYQHQGCIDSAHVTIDVLTTTEVIPSAFTPNGDGINDVFRVVNLAFGRLVEMHIYNRWGQEVCRTNDNEKGWDGMFEGVPQDLGVFNYYIIIERENHKEVHYKGTVTLIR